MTEVRTGSEGDKGTRASAGGGGPSITAVVATRNRAGSILATVESILANDHPSFELLIVDQSDDDGTERALAPLRGDSRLRYRRTETVGKCRAQNLALADVQSPSVALTDDDCEVPTTWLSVLAQCFEDRPSVGMIFTNVVPPPFDESAGFVPCYRRSDDETVTSIWGKLRARGIGASMAVRTEAARSVGGFDESMGPGGRFPDCDDGDMAVRLLLSGWDIHETPAAEVVHHGFRTWEQGRELTRRNWVGIGAMCAKPLRGGRWDALPLALYEFGVIAVGGPIRALLVGRRPQGLRQPWFFLVGFCRAWRWSVDRDTLRFVVSDPSPQPRSPSADPVGG